ncbi:sensor histidine kinase [Chitinophagaceae bacterium LWZ2-11]
MNRLNSKYVYLLILLSLVVSITLQSLWLSRLFVDQKTQVKHDIEQVVSNAGIQSSYISITKEINPGGRFKDFFLSPQWLQMRQAFDDLKGVHSNFHYRIDNDSSIIEMQILFSNKPGNTDSVPTDIEVNKESRDALQQIEADGIRTMDSIIKKNLADVHISISTNHAVYSYAMDTLSSASLSSELYKQADYVTGKYAFNFKYLHKYQLVANGITGVVIYRMRFYLLSSLIMILFTSAAFYFLLQLMRKRRLYADAKVAFTNNMTHEFKTPVATIAVALESITKYDLINEPEKLQNYLDISRHELQRLNLMIEKVLNLNPENDAYHSLNQTLYDVQSGLKQVIASMQVQLGNNKSVIHLVESPEPCFVFGDPVHLTNVFYNLIDNAIKYAGPQLNLQITCHNSNKHITIYFKDNGPGVEKIYQEKIFERFFRIPLKGDRHNVKGSGLGLHYVQQIIEKHGGSITIKSELGKGSNFIIVLPVAV